MVNEAEERDKTLLCVRCNQEIADNESYIVSQCNAADCGTQYSHQDCVYDYLTTNKHTSQSGAQLKQQNKAIHAPHSSLKSLPCPKEDCSGRVKEADRVIQTKKKKLQKAALAVIPEAATKDKDTKPRKGPKQAQATKKHVAGTEQQVSKAKPFTQFQGRADVPKPAKASSLANVPQRIKPERNLSNRFGVLTTVNEDDDEEEGTPEQQQSKAEQSPSREEVDAAIKLGVLPVNFRTDWCKDFFKGKCSRGKFCSRAHSLEQLQFDAAIAAGKLDQRFKMQFCGDANQGGCSIGVRCPNANSAKELRIHALFAESELDTSYHASLCPEFTEDGRCSEGLACFYAHGRAELRAEAAALLGNVDADYNFQLCENWYTKGRCQKGDRCHFAHGLNEVRVCAAVHYSELNPGYKTVRCQRPRCEFPWKCHYYHSDRDQRRPVVRKTVYCPVWKELGHCEIVNCHWAHGVDDLDTNAFAYDFPQAQGGTEGSWAEVAKQKLTKLRTGPSSINEGNKPAVRTELHSNGAEPLAVYQGKMPAQADAGQKPARKRNKHKPDFFQLCPRYEEKGICNFPGCEYAHGAPELEHRKVETEAKRRGARPPPLNPETAQLGRDVMQHLRNMKIRQCSEGLISMGFTQGAYEMARKCGGDQILAAQHFADGKPPPAQQLTCDVRAEAASVLTMASDVGWTLGRLEEGIKNCKGNVDSIFSAHMGDTYDAPSTPGSDATTPAPEYQQSLSELKGKGIAVDDNGFPMYDPTLFGSDVRSDRQDPHMAAASSSGDKSEFQKMMEAQAGMFDANGNLLPDAQAQFQADERREREQNQARREASMFESFGRGSSSNSVAPQAGTSRHTAQNDLNQGPQPGLQPAPHTGPAPTHRQPPGFTPDRPGPVPNADALNGFRQDVPLQQDRLAHASSQQQAPKAPQQDPLAQFAADLNANGFEHARNQPQAPTQRPQSMSAANANGFAHTQQPAMQSYGSDGFSDSALSGFNQPSHSVSGDFTSELWAADSRKKSQDWAWVQQQKQQERSAQRTAAQQPAARQKHPQQNGVQQGFGQHSHAQPQIPPHIVAPQFTQQQQQQPLLQTPPAPVYSAPAAPQAHGFDPSEALAKKVQLVDDGHDMDVGNLDDFILSSLMD